MSEMQKSPEGVAVIITRSPLVYNVVSFVLGSRQGKDDSHIINGTDIGKVQKNIAGPQSIDLSVIFADAAAFNPPTIATAFEAIKTLINSDTKSLILIGSRTTPTQSDLDLLRDEKNTFIVPTDSGLPMALTEALDISKGKPVDIDAI